MLLKSKIADFYIPDGSTLPEALERTSHLGIVAHQDDLELLAYDGILKCFGKKSFFGVDVTNGVGCQKSGIYASLTDKEMQLHRKNEQIKAALIGEYSGVIFLDYSSEALKNNRCNDPTEDIESILLNMNPSVVYTHNPMDKHDTHVAVALRVINALRNLPDHKKPQAAYGCEVWRDLDWVAENDKVIFDVSEYESLGISLLGVYESQILSGKRYDLAAIGRRRAHAAFGGLNHNNAQQMVIYGIDLTPLIWNKGITIENYLLGYIERFKCDVMSRINKLIV